MNEIIDRVGQVLRKECEVVFGASWNNDIAWRFSRAAIEAMREPTDAMDDAGDATFDWTSSDTNGSWYPQKADATECWQAMIDAALK